MLGLHDARQLAPWPESVHLRDWQFVAFTRYASAMPARWLVEATPGAGKTVLMLRVAHHHLSAESVARVVVAVPTDHLRRQFARSAAAFGLHLDDRFRNAERSEPSDMHGVVVTYAQIGRAPDVFRKQSSQRPTFVLLDEIHHAGDSDKLTWGRSLKLAFGGCPYVLVTSGTAFREDDNPIPFVTYRNGESQADFTYGYEDALRDGVCRPLLFPSFDGTMTWRSADGQEVEASFAHRLTKSRSAERLRTAITTMDDGSWLHTTFVEAHRRLLAVRAAGHANAGGLVICQNQDHARKVAELVERVAGRKPPVAVSDDPGASRIITDFALSSDPWLVAVRMVSEGVDIPRLRVGVYATNVSTGMYFRQAAGRFVRVVQGLDEQTGYVYIPRDRGIVEHAAAIAAERRHVIPGEDETEQPEDVEHVADADLEPTGTQRGLFPSAYQAIDSTGSAAEVVRPGVLPGMAADVPPIPEAKVEPTRRDEKAEVRGRCQTLANQLAHSRRQNVKDVHLEWLRNGGKPAAKATLDDLRRKADWLRKQLRARGRTPKC